MEVYRLNASLNWDSNFEANPWDFEFANIDIAARCFPTENLQLPIRYILLKIKKGIL
jgi:hypothetical protein